MNYINKIKVTLFKSLFIAFPLLVFTSCATDDTQTVTNFNEITMQDEFDTDDVIDTSIWGFNIGTGTNGWGNNELQYYTDRTENASVQNGMLLITARKEDYQGSGYTSARLLTQNKFDQTYGRFEARIKVPYGQGMWPAFWLLGADVDEVGWPQCGEIDIMENRGNEPTLVSGTVHGPGYSGGESISKSYTLTNDRYDTGFHIFGIEWGPEYINYYIDDVLYNQITPEDVTGEWVFDHPFFIIINLAIGGDYGGAPTAETVFPQSMLVDYVRVYKNSLN
ncbi:glycoside hydrolase family 16 protein [Algibacter miyuki]|uniref:Glycoside hydrolase family 16 protein n=1 Tax=Algibacter miyuki TaxID=1306933 RepID=A0ABV5GV37_9FLAO|nr:glycoside hydrolase family 16 protein [Algibacter miyuki]MDN3664824.1 glycoside hydrolase family 16 protein [Algibacter miyuki]